MEASSIDDLDDHFGREFIMFQADAYFHGACFSQSRNSALQLLETYQSGVQRSDDGLLRCNPAATVDEFLEANPGFTHLMGHVVNHRIDYIGNVGMVYLEGKPGAKYSGAVTLSFIVNDKERKCIITHSPSSSLP